MLRLARALKDEDIDVHVIAPHASGLAESGVVDGIEVTRFRYAPEGRETLAYSGTMAAQVAGSWRARFDLYRLIRSASRAISVRRPGFDVVHAHWWFPSGFAATRGAAGGSPVVTTMHGSDVRLSSNSKPAGTMMRRTLSRSAKVTAVSRWLASEATRITGVEVTTVAPMPVDTDVFTPRTVHRDGLLFVGRLDPQKGLEVLLTALGRLPHDVSLTVVGDGSEAQRLRARAASLGVAGRVRWAGAEPQTALADYYRNARLVVAPATAPEGLGLVPIEALLCETPVIASNVGGLPDVVDDGETGRLIVPNDPDLLATTIAELLGAPDRLEQWGRAGRMRVLDRFTPKACARTYRTVYEEAVRAGK